MTVDFYTEELEDGSTVYVADDYDHEGLLVQGDDWLTCFKNYLEARELYLEALGSDE